MAEYSTPDDFPERSTWGIPRVTISVPGYGGSPDLSAGIGDDGVQQLVVELNGADPIWGNVHNNGSEGTITATNNATNEALTTAAAIAAIWSSTTPTPARQVTITNGTGGADNWTVFFRYPVAASYRAKRAVTWDADAQEGTDIGPYYYAGVNGGWRYFYVPGYAIPDGESRIFRLQEHRTMS